MILILSQQFDPHADHAAEILSSRGVDFVRFDPADFPSKARLSIGYSPDGRMRASLHSGEHSVDLTQLQAVWSRRPRVPAAHVQIEDAAIRRFVEFDCKLFVEDVWNALTCPWLPAQPAIMRRAAMKATQLRVAAELGFELPPTLFTVSREEFLDFYNEHNGNIITKLPGPAFDQTIGEATKILRYTEVVSKRDVGYAASLQFSPMILQAYVPKRLELRITVVGQQVFAAEIHSQLTHHTRYDWRRYDLTHTPHFPHTLPVDVHQRCVQLVERLGLRYGAIDMIVTPDGRYVFLEINPSGQYLWIELHTKLPITAAICDLLMAGRGAVS